MRRILTSLALAAAVLAVAGIAIRPHTASSGGVVQAQPVDVLADRVARAQQHLREMPDD